MFVCLFAQLAIRSIKSLAPCLYKEKKKETFDNTSEEEASVADQRRLRSHINHL